MPGSTEVRSADAFRFQRPASTTRDAGAFPLPGVVTPTDVTLAAGLGIRICKLFPASLVGPDWLAAIRGPFPDGVRGGGGVDPSNAADYLRAGAVGWGGFGSSIDALFATTDPAGELAALHALVPWP